MSNEIKNPWDSVPQSSASQADDDSIDGEELDKVLHNMMVILETHTKALEMIVQSVKFLCQKAPK